jgi:DNA-binding NarL/FixJ family response regulator
MHSVTLDDPATSAVVVDDMPEVRALVRVALKRLSSVRVVGEASDGLEGVEVVGRLQPDVVILDLAMPGMDGVQALPRLKEACPTAKVIVLTGLGAESMMEQALHDGADLYLEKDVTPDEIVGHVESLVGPRTVPARARRARQPGLRPDPQAVAALAASAGEFAPIGLLVVQSVDGAPVTAYANPAATALLGASEVALGSRLSVLLPELADLVADVFAHPTATGVRRGLLRAATGEVEVVATSSPAGAVVVLRPAV